MTGPREKAKNCLWRISGQPGETWWAMQGIAGERRNMAVHSCAKAKFQQKGREVDRLERSPEKKVWPVPEGLGEKKKKKKKKKKKRKEVQHDRARGWMSCIFLFLDQPPTGGRTENTAEPVDGSQLLQKARNSKPSKRVG